MRNIKFRIWVKNKKTFTYFDVGEYPHDISGIVSEPEQYTGIKDTNDAELYEGDTVTVNLSLAKEGEVNVYTGVIEFCKKFGHFGVKIDTKDVNVRNNELPAPFGYFLDKSGRIMIERTGNVHNLCGGETPIPLG